MGSTIRLGILGAGLGSRMQTEAKSKPLAKIGSQTILERLLAEFKAAGINDIHCALRDELLQAQEKNWLNALPGVKWIFVNTESSLHTLGELVADMGTKGPALFSMADTILKPEDLRAFIQFCERLESESCAILVTPFVDDEKPLWVQVNSREEVEKFDAKSGDYVTSGMYFLSPSAMRLVPAEIQKGTHKMRNFLAKLLEAEIPIKTFVVAKSIDVDHPSDLKQAEQFLQNK